MQAELSVEIDRPIAEVFDFAINHVAEWSVLVIEDEVIDEKPGGGVGTTFRIVTEEKGRKMEFHGVVTRPRGRPRRRRPCCRDSTSTSLRSTHSRTCPGAPG